MCIIFGVQPHSHVVIVKPCRSFFSFAYGQGLDKFAFQVLNGVGDLLTLKDILKSNDRQNWSSMTKDEIIAKVNTDYSSSVFNPVPAGKETASLAGHIVVCVFVLYR